MKNLIILLLAVIICLNPMCSGATLECEDEIIYNENVEAGSFVYRFEKDLGTRRYLRIEIITNGVKTKKIIEEDQVKMVVVNGKEMWETAPVFISSNSQVIVYFVECEYVY